MHACETTFIFSKRQALMKSDGHQYIYLHLLVAAEEEAKALGASPLADAPPGQPRVTSSQLVLSRRPADSEEPGYQVLEEALSEIDSHLRVGRGQRTVYCPLCPSFSITLPALINECRDVRNRCTEHVRGKDHLAQLAQPLKQQTLGFKPAPSGSGAHDSR
jgi:hypothetical protein